MNRRWALLVLSIAVAALLGGAALQVPTLRSQVRAVLRPEPPAPITPIAVLPIATRSPTPISSATPVPPTPTVHTSGTALPRQLATATPVPSPTTTPAPTATVGPVAVGDRLYEAYIPAASKAQQAYQYSCEFDAAWVVLQTFGRDVSVDEMIPVIGVDDRIEPTIGEETVDGFIIYGGDITTRYSGDYRTNFLARSSGQAMTAIFEHWGLDATPVRDRAGVEAALRSGRLVWMKTTVDFKPWRPALWRTPEGATIRTVLGNDHAVVAIGFNDQAVVIRDVLGPTSSNWERPYEYEVDWETFLAAWGAQDFDGLAVGPS